MTLRLAFVLIAERRRSSGQFIAVGFEGQLRGRVDQGRRQPPVRRAHAIHQVRIWPFNCRPLSAVITVAVRAIAVLTKPRRFFRRDLIFLCFASRGGAGREFPGSKIQIFSRQPCLGEENFDFFSRQPFPGEENFDFFLAMARNWLILAGNWVILARN